MGLELNEDGLGIGLGVERVGGLGYKGMDWIGSKCIPANPYDTVAATREAMSEARLPLAYRDGCAGLLIPLNRCRYEEYYLPWKCEVS